MKVASTLLVTVALLLPGCATYPDSDTITLTGQFIYLDTSSPGCGIVAWASKATFVTDASGKNVDLAVPCIEMFFAKNATGEERLLKVGERYTIVLTRQKPVPDMGSPFIFNKKPWYLSSASQ